MDVKDSQKQEASEIYRIVDRVPPDVVLKGNKKKSWDYGYNEEYDMVVISKDGTIGEVYAIITSQRDTTKILYVALPSIPEQVYQRDTKQSEQYWERQELPSQLAKIKTIFQWHDMPSTFKDKWIDYINNEFDRRECGFWFRNNGVPTYITGSHYMYLQWASIDIGYPDFREANRILWIYWEACKADTRSYGMNYVKIRRSGSSFMGSSEAVNIGTLAKDSRIGGLSKTGTDSKKMFIDKIVPISNAYPFFFKPIQDGMDKPKTEISYRVPATKITKNNMGSFADTTIDGLNTTIDWRNTDNNSYDGEKLIFLNHDEAGKYIKPVNILDSWRVQKTCLRLGRRVIGKCWMGTTVNAKKKGGAEYKMLYDDSDINDRNANGQTRSGLYAIFIPMEWNMEGFIDIYGWPVMENPEKPVRGIDGEWIKQGAIDYWKNEEESLKNNPDALNEFYRQFPRTETHAFRDETNQSIFNLTKLYQQIDYNDTLIMEQHLTRGRFSWKNGIRFSSVVWSPDKSGSFLMAWMPPKERQNNVIRRNDKFYPGNEDLGVFGADTYDITGTVDESRGSKAGLTGLTKPGLHDYSYKFFLLYLARPQTAEICFEEMLMALWFYGMPVLGENAKPRFLYHLRNAGMRAFSLNRVDKHRNQLSKSELELGGTPNSSQAFISSHATAIETYIEQEIGIDHEGTYRDPGCMGYMPFQDILLDWVAFDINNRTKHDASIATGLAIMAIQKHLYLPEQKRPSKISVNLARYSNDGSRSRLIPNRENV